MKKAIVLAFIFLCHWGYAQTNNNANPFSSNPFDSNPFVDNNQKTNFLKDNGSEKDSKSNKNKKTENYNNKSEDGKEDVLRELSQQQNPNNADLYKYDPDYLKYLNSQLVDPNILNGVKKEDSIANIADEQKNQKKRRIYGGNFFQNNVFDLSDKNASAPPLDYRLGPGDELIISMWNGAELQTKYTLANDGSIFPLRVGKINLNGLTFDEARNVITNRLKKVVPSGTNIDLQMGKSKMIRVTIEGEVEKPGTYSISAFNTALNALFKAGGLTELGNMRKIEVKRQGRTVEIIDLYEYLQRGRSAEEVYLEDNDYIYVDVYEKLIQAQGGFKRPMYYQLTSDEGLYDLVELAGGPSFNARKSQIQIKTIHNEEERYINVPGNNILDKNNLSDFILNDGDVVTLKQVNEGLKNIAKIEGAVNYPDEYEVKNTDRLLDVIEKAGGLQGDAYLTKAFIFRGSTQLESDAIKVDLTNLTERDINNIEIKKGDRIKILSNNTFDEKFQIYVNGYVRKPGFFPYSKNLKLKDILLLAGGLTLDAENGRIEISNIVDSVDKYNVINKNGTTVRIISINSNLEIDEASDKIAIKPMDRIYIRRKVEFTPMERVNVVGEVLYPGEHVLVKKNETISAIVKRTGGLTASAYPKGARLIRKKAGGYIVIDLVNAMEYPNSKYDIGLSDSDILIIPTINDIVSVKGEVQSEVNMKYDRDNKYIMHYIGAAGGFGNEPWKARINVKYQNGKIANTKSFLGIKKYPKITEGCTITIPKKPYKENKTKFSEILSYTLSTLTTLATLVVLANTL